MIQTIVQNITATFTATLAVGQLQGLVEQHIIDPLLADGGDHDDTAPRGCTSSTVKPPSCSAGDFGRLMAT
ncbi:hypothetical protein PF011_g25288 [Phytophthora fragariae]|uniref:Uncharacterized protein n=1 Tax=Phytophthora fragariae TaxID=53985 RepID=A0A6A3HZI8_9STRA|nr:hypothetical protein PF011_g25288 [Phytophthora fragariae]